jgi:glycosyltransferase involved in cell wall biosynthesis
MTRAVSACAGRVLYTEAVSAGRPVIATRGIYAALGIERGGAEGEIFAPYTSVALAEAIARLLPHLTERKSKAAQNARDFALRHSGAAYVDVISDIANSTAAK